MAVYQEKDKGTWRVVFRYTDFTGERKQTQKRGFTGSVGADQAIDTAFFDLTVHLPDDRLATKLLAQVFRNDHIVSSPPCFFHYS